MESTEQPAVPANNLQVDPEIKSLLQEAAKWASFLGIVGYILVGFMVLAAFFIGTFLHYMSRNVEQSAANNPLASGVFPFVMGGYFMLIALLYFFPSHYLHQFGVKTQAALRHNEQLNFTLAFTRLKSFFKFFGILTIIIFVLYGIAFVFLVLFGSMFENLMQGTNW